jgi:hypothetical protein
LSITRSNDVVFLRWPDPARAYSLQAREDLSDAGSGLESTTSYENGFTTVTYNLSESGSHRQFFRLTRYIYAD